MYAACIVWLQLNPKSDRNKEGMLGSRNQGNRDIAAYPQGVKFPK